MRYRREIDGLRAVAVVPVILFHAGFDFFSGGFVGVDIFFVISGYLITTLLMDDIEQGKFSIARFYERRARRILPALCVVLLSCLPFTYMWMLPLHQKDFGASLVTVILSLSNFYFLDQINYFSPNADLQPLLHTWSLAVEEQYYFVFPLFLLAIRRFSLRSITFFVCLFVVLSFAVSEWGQTESVAKNFFFTPSRLWEIGVGSICSLITRNRKQKPSNFLGFFGLFLISYSVFAFNATTPMPSVFALIPVLGAAFIILFASEGTWVSRLLSFPPFVGVGLISYSAYLWHQPVFAFARLRSTINISPNFMALLCLLTLLLAWVTWRFVEQPFRIGGKPFLLKRNKIFLASGTAVAFFCIVGLLMFFHEAPFGAIGNEARESTSGKCNYDEGNCYQIPNASMRVALWGDSYADAFSISLGHLLNKNGISLTLYIKHSCPSLLSVLRNEDSRRGLGDGARCKIFTEKAFRSIMDRKFDIVIITSAYEWYSTGLNFDGKSILLDDGLENKSSGESTVAASLAQTVVDVENSGAQVVLVGPHPVVNDFELKLRSYFFGEIDQIYGGYQSAKTVRDGLIAALARRQATWVEESGLNWFCNGSTCPVVDRHGMLLLYDGVHISSVLAPNVARHVFELFQELN